MSKPKRNRTREDCRDILTDCNRALDAFHRKDQIGAVNAVLRISRLAARIRNRRPPPIPEKPDNG